MLARELQDIAQSVGDVASAVRDRGDHAVVVNVPEQPPAAVVVNLPEQWPIVVNVPEQPPAAVVVNLPEQPPAAPPNVNVESKVYVEPQPLAAYAVTVTRRDDNGFIAEFLIEPIGRVP